MATRKAHIDLGFGLTPREAAADALFRLTQALDDNDEDLMRSALVDDAVFDRSALSQSVGVQLPELKGVDDIVNGVLAHVGPMASSHHISNLRVRMNESLDEAEVTSYALAQHKRPSEAFDPRKRAYLLYGNTYWADVVKDGNDERALWRIRRFEIRCLWVEGDPSVAGR